MEVKSKIMYKIFFSVFLLLICCSSHILAQGHDDAQLWQNIYFEKNLTRKFNIHINEEGRLTENYSRPSYIYADIGLTYKAGKYLHLSAAWVPIAKRQNNDLLS